ncbi:ATP-grasp domain-containing protein [Paraburkholderia sp.]|uniref:ATP-grasp domain-containing protein n=1 Tax=Paraburkholderia sp. TaxID=1926495 RepID=UPI002383F9DA|nr:ATP-grasp domain-containing protein [Paraburkholderia sp.]MDE1179171.1 ATP-grasp domain-containing protein [Paraburkholderia sp.]
MIKLFVYEYLSGGGIDPEVAGIGSLADLSALIVEGRAMRDALTADLCELDGVQVTYASSRFERSPAMRAAHATTVPVQSVARPGEILSAFVARIAHEHDYTCVIAPECDGLLLQLHDVVGDVCWLGCRRDAIRIASSKRATAACLAAHGIAVTPALPPGICVSSAAADDATRWVVKPDDGAGGLDTFVYERLDDACAEYTAREAAGRDPVLQAWVEGEPLSLSLIAGYGQAELVSINRQRIGIPDAAGSSRPAHVVEFSGVDVDQISRDSDQGRVLETLTQDIVAALPGLRGFVGVDLVWHPRRGPVVIEVNPRLTAAYVELSARLGRNLASSLLTAHGVSGFGARPHVPKPSGDCLSGGALP